MSPLAVVLGVRRHVAHGVLTLQFFENNFIDAGQVVQLLGRVGHTTTFLGQHVQFVLRVAVLFLPEVGFVGTERDRVDDDVTLARLLFHIFESEDRLSIVTVREHHDGAPVELVASVRFEVFERNIDCVVERGRAGERGRADGVRHFGEVRGELDERQHPAAERDHLNFIARPKGVDEPYGGLLSHFNLLLHARGDVEQDHHFQREIAVGKKLDVLLDTALVDGEIFFRQPGDETAVFVEERDREAHRVHSDTEAGNVRLLRERRRCHQGRCEQPRNPTSHQHQALVCVERCQSACSALDR